MFVIVFFSVIPVSLHVMNVEYTYSTLHNFDSSV